MVSHPSYSPNDASFYATPFVQVLKELLAQRKLNEPYSGGLSSYALLLLVLALVRERAMIREQIELVEQQKKAMVAGELNSFSSGSGTTAVFPSSAPTTPPSQFNSTVHSGKDSKEIITISKDEKSV